MIPYLWERLPCNEEAAAGLAAALQISPAVARLLAIRGIHDPEIAERFLHPSLDHLHDPFRLADMAVAVDRILAAECIWTPRPAAFSGCSVGSWERSHAL